jgi:hypothetical protein
MSGWGQDFQYKCTETGLSILSDGQSVLQLVCLSGLLMEYNFYEHVASDVGISDQFLPADDLSVLQLVCLSGLLMEYNFYEHVASDVGISDQFLPAESFGTQDSLNYVANWTRENKMKINEGKCNFMILSRSEEQFTTRLTINNVKLDRISETKILGLYISDDLSWSRNCKEICIKAYSRLQMITKLKYVGV